jgi:hypothetical protein
MARRTPPTLLLSTRAAAHLAVIGIALVVAGCRTTSAPDAATTEPAAAIVSRTTERAGLPDDRTIDTVTYYFTDRAQQSPTSKPVIVGPAGSLGITRQGRLYYSYQTEPHTGSGGQWVSKEWDVPADEAAKLLDAIVDDGLLKEKYGRLPPMRIENGRR